MNKNSLDKLSLSLVIIGALNWLMVGIFQVDVVSYLFGGGVSVISRTIYSIIGLAGIYTLSLLFRDSIPVKE
jgi:uncharacterized membrane protein YuzA (DUF378 family)